MQITATAKSTLSQIPTGVWVLGFVSMLMDISSEMIGFYSRLFGVEPAVAKPDYAKWMIDDPRINFAISQRGHAPGIHHLGFHRSRASAAALTAMIAAFNRLRSYMKPISASSMIIIGAVIKPAIYTWLTL